MMKFRLSMVSFVSRGLWLLAVLSLLNHQNARASSGEEIIKKVQAKIQSIPALTLRFSAQIQMEGDLIEEEGRIYFAQGGRFRMESSGQLLICDGKTLWAYAPADSQVVVFAAEAGGASFFTPQQLLFDYPDKYEVKSVENVQHGGLPCYLLTMIPREVTDPVASLKVWVDRKEYLTRRIEIEELTESKAGFSFEDIEIRQNLPDSTFQFAPPPSVEVIDMR
ncbi:MAG TPA: outer-membrane lipoprotein carrier protein LolA [bacterium]